MFPGTYSISRTALTEVGLDVFNDPVFASSLQPELQSFYVPCSSRASKTVFIKLASL